MTRTLYRAVIKTKGGEEFKTPYERWPGDVSQLSLIFQQAMAGEMSSVLIKDNDTGEEVRIAADWIATVKIEKENK